MFHYLFTNDLRITKLKNSLIEAGSCFRDDCVPNATEDKNANNNMNTLGFYFNLTKESNCTKECVRGNARKVVLNFIKKFQFPNPRTPTSMQAAVDDGIQLAPLRVILQVLYMMKMSYPEESYLTKGEIAEYIFFNDSIAKNRRADLFTLIKRIVEERSDTKEDKIPSDDVLEANGCYWKQCQRQIREMVKILCWSGCVVEDDNSSIRLFHDKLTKENKADLFEILTFSDFWIPDIKKTDNENKEAYQNYMDVEALEMDEILEKKDPLDQKKRFRTWMVAQVKDNGEPYSSNTIASYISQMERGYKQFHKINDYESIFQIQDADTLENYTNYLFTASGFDEFNEHAGNKACSCGLAKYKEFLDDSVLDDRLTFNTKIISNKPRNRIVFGAPGTGKSFTVNKEVKELIGEDNETDFERVTFHPDYSYGQFVGTYKPVPCIDAHGNDAITYEYVPGPFMRVYVNALKNGKTKEVKPFVLIIEEINRANVAAVFGDVFQLLDRDDNEVSEYPIQASEDIKNYLAKELGGRSINYNTIRIPNNMFIWVTMNSADQGVYPMDTAFKRRWDFTYLGIDDNEGDLVGNTVLLGTLPYLHKVEWNTLRKAINRFLAEKGINEDKQLGPYFISKKIVVPSNGNEIDRKKFIATFKNKVIMYLFEDACKQKRTSLFSDKSSRNMGRYSDICKEFDDTGVLVFCHEIVTWSKIEDVSNSHLERISESSEIHTVETEV